MKLNRIALFCTGLVTLPLLGYAQQSQPAAKTAKPPVHQAQTQSSTQTASSSILKTQKQKISYSLGLSLGTSMKEQAVDLDLDIFTRGIRDALSNGKALLTDDEVRAVLTDFQKKMSDKQKADFAKLADKNKQAGEAFLAANKTKEGVITTASGLQYKVLKQGNGPKPKETDTVTANYRGTLIDGTEFDNSYKRGEPATFRLDRVIAGWKEALLLMPVGSKYQLYIPSSLCYGERAPVQEIGPNSTLIFEVELLAIKAPEPAQTQSKP
jgi:FKBP-type peptidyl-prolyl cis-trans isomerase